MLCITARLLCVIKKLSCTQQTTITQQISTCNRLKKHIFPKHLFKHQSRSRMELGSSKPHWLDNLIKHSTHIIELRIPLKITIKLIFVTKKLDFCTFTHACSCSMSQKKKINWSRRKLYLLSSFAIVVHKLWKSARIVNDVGVRLSHTS